MKLRGSHLGFVLLAAALANGGCRHESRTAPPLDLTWTLRPQPPVVGASTLTVTLRDAFRAPVTGATVRLEAHMTHPGMAPALANGTERSPGVYELPFLFEMQGDWMLLVSVVTPTGTRVERRIDIANVRP